MWSVGGRLGFLVTPRVLAYGLVAYSRMNLTGKLDAYFTDPFPKPYDNPSKFGLKIDSDVDGITFGGGVEAKLDQRVSLKLEYRFTNFDDASASAKTVGSNEETWYKKWGNKQYEYNQKTSYGGKLDIGDTDLHTIRAVLSFKLGDIHDRRPEPLK